jgi:hypothetical protein
MGLTPPEKIGKNEFSERTNLGMEDPAGTATVKGLVEKAQSLFWGTLNSGYNK